MAESKKDTKKDSKKCGCNPGWGVVSWILKAIGLWLLVAGFATQFGSTSPASFNYMVLGWYFGGFLLFGVAKLADWKACGSCDTHFFMCN